MGGSIAGEVLGSYRPGGYGVDDPVSECTSSAMATTGSRGMYMYRWVQYVGAVGGYSRWVQ